MYEIDGTPFTASQLENFAAQKGITFQELLNKNPNIIDISVKMPGTNKGAIVPNGKAPVMVSSSESFFSDSQEKDTAIERAFGKNSLTDFFGDIYRSAQKGLQQASLTDPSIDLFRAGEDADDETILNYINANKDFQQNVMQSDEMRDFNKIYEEAGGGWWGFIKGAANNPSVLTQELVSSIAMQIGSLQSDEVATAATAGLATGAIAGTAIGPVGTIGGGIAGAMSGAMSALETGLTFSELLNEKIGEDLTIENVRAFLQNGEELADLKNKALGRGITIGAIELATMGLAAGVGGKIASAGFRGAPLLGLGTAGAIEVTGGGLGEVAGRFVAGQEMDVAEIGFEAFAGLGSAPVTLTRQAGSIGKNINRIKINKELKNTDFKNISDFFLNQTETNDTSTIITSIKRSDELLEEEVIRRVKNKELTKEQGEEILNNFSRTKVANEIINRSGNNLENRNKTIDLFKEREELKQKIDFVNEKIVTKKEQQRVDEIEKQLSELFLQESISFAEKGAEKLGLAGVKSLTIKELKEKYKGKTQKQINEIIKAQGFVDPETGEIIINKDIAVKDVAVSVGSHELLHTILNRALKGKDRQLLLDQFKKIIGEEQVSIINKKLKDKKYTEAEIVLGDEFFTAYSDAINLNQIQYEENLFTKIGDFIRPILRKFGFSKIKFNTGRDVYNFLKEYNKSIEKGQLNQDIINIGAEVRNETYQLSKSSSDKVQEIYESQGAANAMDIIDEFKPITNRIVNKYKNVPGFEFELLRDEVETGKRGILDMIMSYTPEKANGAPLAAYINKFLPARAIEAAQRILGTEFTLDVTEAKGVTDTTTEQQTEIVKEEPSKELQSLRKKMGIGDEIKPVVFNAVRKIFGTRLPNVNEKTFLKQLEKSFRTELKKPISKLFGKGEVYESFLRDNFETIYNSLPQSIFNRRLKEFAEPVLDKDGKQKREKTAEGNKIFTKKKISKAEFIKYFLGDNVGRSTQGTRKTAIVEAVAEAFAFDATMEVLADPNILQKVKDIADLQGIKLPQDYIEQISAKINRPIGFQFAKGDNISWAEKNNAEYYDLTTEKDVNKYLAGVEAMVKRPYYRKGLLSKSTIKFQSNLEFTNQEMFSEGKYFDKKYEEKNLKELVGDSTLLKDIPSAARKKLQKYIKNEKLVSPNKRPTKVYGKNKANDAFGGNFEKLRNANKEYIDFYNLRNSLMMDEYWSFIYKALNDPELKEHKMAIYYSVVTVINERNHPHALGARVVSIGKNKSGGIEWEHAVPVSFAMKFLLESATTKNQEQFNEDLRIIKKNYTLIGLSKVENKKLNDANLKDEMPLINGKKWDPYKNFWWQRYLNEKVSAIDGGIDTANQEWFDDSENIFEKYNNKGTIQFSRSLDKEFNELIQDTTGVPFYTTFSPVKAKLLGKGKGKKFFIPYSADDFVGLLYATLGKGKVGDQQMKWYEENLIRPFSRGIQKYEAAKQKSLRDWMVLKKLAKKDVPGGLNKTNETGFTNQNSLRIYMWQRQKINTEGISKKEVRENVKIVNNDPKLKAFAERLMALNPEGYPAPSVDWIAGDITTDLVSYVNDVKRKEYLTNWKENVDQIFTKENKNKLRALYGDSYVKALDNMLYRMENGRNRFKDASDAEKTFMNWTNNSVGAIMFFNARSAVLQTLSAVNFINFSDNNPINAALALANFPQYVKDFVTLFNSDFLKQRRSGLQTDVNADEIANAAATSKNKARAMLAAILKFGFTPTQIADSFAIASGGATFYRNRINKYKKQGLSQSEAEQKAFTDFQEIAEETQQSARPDRISMQQAGSLGRLILAFGNTPMQYARLTKKATLDLINGRGDWKTNISKIAYYSVIQNIIFSALQQGLFALLFDDEEEDKEKSRYFRIGNSSVDTLLRGIGVYGAAAATVKNLIIRTIEESKKSRPDYSKLAIEATSLSPPINSKLRKLESAGKTFTYKQSKEKIFTEGLSLENPGFLAIGKVISAGTNLPADRVVQKMDHIYTAMEPETELWQSIALSLGWSEWDLGMIERQTKKSKKFNPRQGRKSFGRINKRKIKR